MVRASLRAGLIGGALVVALLALQAVLGLFSEDLSILFGCLIILLSLPIFFNAGRMSARYAGQSEPLAGASAAVVAMLIAAWSLAAFVMLGATSGLELNPFLSVVDFENLRNFETPDEIVALGIGLAGIACIGLTLGLIAAAALGAIGAWAGLKRRSPGEREDLQPPGGEPGLREPDHERPHSVLSRLGGCVLVVFVCAVVILFGYILVDSGVMDDPLVNADGLFGEGTPGEGAVGEVRNCIKSVFAGKLPSCSDTDGIAKPTYLNGSYIGDCNWVDANNLCR